MTDTTPTCYYCKKPFEGKEKPVIASKWFHDNPGAVWAGERDYPDGFAHSKCEKKYVGSKNTGG